MFLPSLKVFVLACDTSAYHITMADVKNPSQHSHEDLDTKEQVKVDQSPASSQFDLLNYHEHNAGRLVVDPE